MGIILQIRQQQQQQQQQVTTENATRQQVKTTKGQVMARTRIANSQTQACSITINS